MIFLENLFGLRFGGFWFAALCFIEIFCFLVILRARISGLLKDRDFYRSRYEKAVGVIQSQLGVELFKKGPFDVEEGDES